VADSFHLDAQAKKCIAETIDLKKLHKRTVESIDLCVNCYRATISGSASTTVANTLLALRQLEKPGRPRQESLALFADDRAAVDYTTHNAIQPLAKAVLDGRPGANDVLSHALLKREEELAVHPRVATSMEPMRLFCGFLRVIFNGSTAHLKGQITEEEAWRRCRRFAVEIFTAATAAACDLFDRIAMPAGLTAVKETRNSRGERTLRVFELDADTEVETQDYGAMTVAELERFMRKRRAYGDAATLRCSGSFHDRTRVRTDSHLINWGRYGLGIYDTMTETTWHRRERAPSARFEFLTQLLERNPFK
jgi:hypothetical protein